MACVRLVRYFQKPLTRGYKDMYKDKNTDKDKERTFLNAFSYFCPYLSNQKEVDAVYWQVERVTRQIKTDVRLPLDYRRPVIKDINIGNLEKTSNMDMNIKTNNNASWIVAREVRYCERRDRWDEDIVMVGKSIYDGAWYLVDMEYRQGMLVEGRWPRLSNGEETSECQVVVGTLYESVGMRLVFGTLCESVGGVWDAL